jgi:hypothetical protein
MKKLALIAALLLAASPAAAQVATSGQQQSGSQGGQSAPTQAPTTGIFCDEEMTRNVLQRTHRPEHEWLRIDWRIHIE